MKLFKNRPAKHEACTIQYIARMWQSPEPTPTVEDHLVFVKETYPSAPDSGIARSWNKMKEYFSGDDTEYADIQDLINVPSLVAAFAAAPQLSEETPITSTTMSPPPPSPHPITMPRASSLSLRSCTKSSRSRMSRTSDSSNSGSSSSSGGHLTPASILKMKNLFKENFDKFGGDAWTLPSGAVLDDLLSGLIEDLTYESALHSSVIEDIDGVLRLAAQEMDRAALKAMLVERDGERISTLSAPEVAFLQQYDLPPEDLKDLLVTSGWRTIGDRLQEKPGDDFQEVAHSCVSHILTVYRQVKLKVPQEPRESWFTHILWSFLSIALHSHRCLEYQSGEANSQASAYRRNKVHTRDIRQSTGPCSRRHGGCYGQTVGTARYRRGQRT